MRQVGCSCRRLRRPSVGVNVYRGYALEPFASLPLQGAPLHRSTSFFLSDFHSSPLFHSAVTDSWVAGRNLPRSICRPCPEWDVSPTWAVSCHVMAEMGGQQTQSLWPECTDMSLRQFTLTTSLGLKTCSYPPPQLKWFIGESHVITVF